MAKEVYLADDEELDTESKEEWMKKGIHNDYN